MKIKNKFVLILISTLLIFSLILAGCGSNANNNSEKGNKEAENKVVKLKMGHVWNTNNPSHITALDFAKKVKERTNGRVEITVFPNSQVGGDREMAEALERGTLEMSIIGSGALVGFDKRYDFSNLPLIAENYELADKLYFDGGWVGEQIGKIEAEHGMVLLTLTENDFRQITNSKRPIKRVEDLKGVKFRVLPSQILIEVFKKAGAVITTMPFSEVYTGLQQKTIDGQENGVLLSYTSKFYEVQPYFTFSRHSYSASSVVVSKKIWDQLPSDIQQILKEEAIKMSKVQREMNRAEFKKFVDEMKKAGVQFDEFDEQSKKQWREICISVWPMMDEVMGKDFMNELKKKVNEARKELGMEQLVFPQ
jgi:tripartite ATP-independent transporter DctP family solute receptor